MSRVSDARQGEYFEAIERLFQDGTTSGLSEAQLLERFAARRDGAAFEALVERHGPMVLGVCRRFLRDPNDVDDAFQAVFLVLVRRAGDIRRKELLGNWLYGVACRVAVRARALAARRPATTLSEADGDRIAVDLRRPSSPTPDEGGSWLQEEVERLPRRYRAPVVACYFEGRTHEEAAALLGCPLGTVKGRLSRARDLLRKRLERRGLTVPAVALAAQLATPDLRAAVPAALARTTVCSGLSLASAASTLMTASAIPLSVRTLTQGVLHAMVVTQIKAVAIPSILIAAGLLAAGAQVAARQDGEAKPKPEQAAVARPEPRVEPPGADGENANDGSGEARRPAAGGEKLADASAKLEPPKSPAPATPAKPAKAVASGGGGGSFGGGGMGGPTLAETRQTIAELSALLSKYDENPSNKAVLDALNRPITLRTTDETTLGDLLKQIKTSVTLDEGKKIPVYVDPKGVEEAGASLSSQVAIDLEDVPLRFSLRLALKQLGLAYCVRDGVLIISSLEGVEQELKEAESELMGLHPEGVIVGPGGKRWFGNMGMGRSGGMGGGQGMR